MSSKVSGKSNSKKGAKRKKNILTHQAHLNPFYQGADFINQLGEAFDSKKNFEHECQASIFCEPFRYCQLPDFIQDQHFLEGLKQELLDQIFYDKNNDLYKFQQTDDLKKISTPHVKAIRKLLYTDFRDWLQEVTSIPFSDQIDLTCSRYDYTDVLLCHDDELDTRRIAFILYLVPPWCAEDGGTLDLFNMDQHGQPQDIVKSIIPACNTLAWFEVTEASHHQVAEVLSESKTRLSVHGWFHAPVVARPDRYIEPAMPLRSHIDIEEETFYEWINPIYLDTEVQGQIQQKFETDSEIELQGFLKDEKYLAVVKILKTLSWQRKGPANKRNYFITAEENLPDILKECVQFLKSEPLFLTLSNLTGLTLHKMAATRCAQSDTDSERGACCDVTPEAANENTGRGNGSDSEVAAQKKRRLNSDSESKMEIESSDDREQITERASNPKCRVEVRKWTPGCYTLVHDTDVEGAEFALDAILFCSCKGWQSEYGGYTSYIARGEDEELLTVNPSENSLALVYRDKDTLKFVKHINSRSKETKSGGEFFDFCAAYYE